ncbi:hypothetical protein [Microbaculum marinum]|uniref:Uncharacterized protein n=1 Tax=Microbaculum marinum TaxID=1764581 RepID=A0AAW9RLM2_9HYPH
MNAQRIASTVTENTYLRGVVQILTLIISGLGFPVMLAFMWWLTSSIDTVKTDLNAVKLDTVEIKGSVDRMEERVGGIQAFATQRNAEQDRRMDAVEKLLEYLRREGRPPY